jgi:hypothetical protein
MVAWTTPPGRAASLTVHPVSWYGVARPRALSGWAGTTMPQAP